MASEIEAHAAALRNAPLQHGEHAQLAAWLVSDADSELRMPEAANKLGMQRALITMKLVDRLHTAAALLMIAAETEGLTRFDWWLRTKPALKVTEQTMNLMREAFEAGGNF